MIKKCTSHPGCFSTVGTCAVLFLVAFLTRSANASEELWTALQEGGKVVLMRHGPVEVGADAGNPLVRDPSCRRERKLSNQGKHKAQEIGSRFEKHQVSVSKVLHSPFCRTAETAHLAFGKASPATYLSLLEILEPGDAERHTLELNRAIGSYSGGGNLVLVTHEPNISAVSFELVNHLDLLIIEPKGDSEFEELGVIRFSEEN